jgi:thioesterase domain-containing protein/aryl carrier-like protein
MVPAQWVVLEQMPLSPNGKLDRKALPKPEANGAEEYQAPQSQIEQQVAAIWSEVLGVERVGLNDNFFELGGHSLRVLLLKERLRQVSGVNLSVSQLMLNPTVRGQVNCLQGSARSELIVKLNSQTQGTPLFMFHPSFGSVHCYTAIALALREQRPVYGVICRALVEEGASVPEWQAMVDDYAAQLLAAQPEGAYRLAGWSLGGNLAMEVAYALEQAGREVEFVGWIDSAPPQWLTPYWDAVVVEQGREACANERRAALLGVMFPAFAEQIEGAWQQCQRQAADEDGQWQAFVAWAEQTLGEAFTGIKEELLRGNEAQISWEVDRALSERLEAADFKPIKAPVSCWWASLSRAGQFKDLIEQNMASVIGQGRIERSVMIDTDHDGIIDSAAFINSLVAAMD